MRGLRVRLGTAVITFLFSVALVASLNSLSTTLLGSRSSNDVRLAIRSASGILRTFEDSDLEAELTNFGNQTVTLVEPGDGSEGGLRTPIISWTVVDAKTNTVLPNFRMGRCGNQNSLDFKEVFTLGPGETHRFKLYGPPRYKGGTFRVSLTYENEPSAKFTGAVMGIHNPIAMWRLRHSTKARVTSNELLLKVIRD